MDALKNLDWEKTLEKIKNFASSDAGRTAIDKTSPLKDLESAQNQLSQIQEALQLVQLGHRPLMDSLNPFWPWHERLCKGGTLKISELLDVKRFCFDSISTQKTLSQVLGPWVQRSAKKIMDCRKILSAIDQLITAEGDIRTDASETLYNLFNEKKSLEKSIRSTLDRLVKNNQIETLLQDRYVTNREGRWVLPIKSGKQHDIEGIIHDSSQTKQTVFMEPAEIIPVNNRLREVEFEIEREVQKLLTQLSKYLSQHSTEMDDTARVLLEVDIRLAQAQFANKVNARVFQFSQGDFELVDVRHPLLSLQDGLKVIPNTIRFEKNKKIMILSGPNAGGKTVLLKAIGLAAHMSRCGLPICASEESQLPFFTRMFVAIGDTQSVDEHLSTFASHLKTLTAATEAQGPGHLILIDEICGSTDPEEGAALAKAFIEYYADNKAFGVITSHLGPLRQLWPSESAIISGSMEYDRHPTYKLFMGIHGRSFALKTAKTVGVPEAVIDRALNFLSPESRKKEEQFNEIENYKKELLDLRSKLTTELEGASEAKEKYKKLLNKFESERQTLVQKSVERAEKRIDKIVEDLKAQKVMNVHKIKSELPQIVKSAPAADSISSEKEFIERMPPGSSGFIVSLNQDGIVQGQPNSKGEVPVLSRSMRIQVHWKDIIPKKSETPSSPVVRLGPAAPLPNEDMEIDLRGLNSDEAVTKLERILDKAVRDQLDKVKIIHGHGSNALKKAVRAYLSRSLYIQKWQAGTEMEGDGITWAILA